MDCCDCTVLDLGNVKIMFSTGFFEHGDDVLGAGVDWDDSFEDGHDWGFAWSGLVLV